jgi:hypothetical protein
MLFVVGSRKVFDVLSLYFRVPNTLPPLEGEGWGGDGVMMICAGF